MLSTRLQKLFCIAHKSRKQYLRKDRDYDLKAVLKGVEEKIFNNRLSKAEINYENSDLKTQGLYRDPLMSESVEREQARSDSKDTAYRTYNISAKEEQTVDMRSKIEAVRQRLSLDQSAFFGVDSDEQFLKRSRRFVDASRFGQQPNMGDLDSVDQEYGRFDVYKGAYNTLVSTNNPYADLDGNRYEEEFLGASIHKFLLSLGDDVLFKDHAMGKGEIKGEWKGRKTLSDETEANLTEEEFSAIRRRDYRLHLQKNKVLPHLDIVIPGNLARTKSQIQKVLGQKRLSGQARLNIYMLYNKGHSIKDICQRFGIAPQRAKAVVWIQQYYFECVLPRISHDIAMMGIILDTEISKYTGTQDYGLDLDWLSSEVNGNIDYGVKLNNRHQPPSRKAVQVQEEFRQIVDNRQRKRMDVVPVGTTRNDNLGLVIKEMRVYRGHGSQRGGLMFSRILRTSNRKQGLPMKVERRMDLGMRKAVEGFGPN